MTAKHFLLGGGVLLILLGITGMVGLLGPTAVDSYFGANWWFNPTENWAYLIAGIVAVVSSMILPVNGQKNLAVAFGVAGVALGLYSMFNPALGGAHFEKPVDTILYTVLGLTALIAARKPVVLG